MIWPAIIGGFYHAAILPIILLEMEQVGTSFFGAVDMAGLVMVSAGITLANIISPKRAGERSVAAPFLSNSPFGFAVAMLVGLGVSCVLTLLVNRMSRES